MLDDDIVFEGARSASLTMSTANPAPLRGPDDAATPDVQDVVAPMPIAALPVCEECWIAASDKVRELIEALDGVVASKLADSSADQACKKLLIAPGGMGKPSVPFSCIPCLAVS
jgi:hypothetical protein